MTSPWQTENEQTQKCRRGRKRQREGGEPDRAETSWKSSRGAAIRWTDGGRSAAARPPAATRHGPRVGPEKKKMTAESNQIQIPKTQKNMAADQNQIKSNPQHFLQTKAWHEMEVNRYTIK